jgi:FkbM family methyltransferase
VVPVRTLRQLLRSIPVVGPALRHLSRSPRFKAFRTDLRLFRSYGTRHPQKIRLQGSGNFIFVDPSEPRGQVLIRGLGRGLQPGLRAIWHAAVVELEPTIVLDVGLNYGEFLFAETYQPNARLVGIEANPQLARWISRSVELHPNRKQLEIMYALASDGARDREIFYVNRAWSGGSSAVRHENVEVDEVEVPSFPVDSLFRGRSLERDTLLFKIDTEGFEPVVLQGMRETILRCSNMLGIVELDTAHLEPLGVDVDKFLGFLFEHFTVYSVDHRGRATRVNAPTVAELRDICGSSHVVTDLLLASNQRIVDRLSLAWDGARTA